MNENAVLLPEMKTYPAVFAVKNEYQIMIPVKSEVLLCVTVNGRDYYDHSNGIIKSAVSVHRVHIPMPELDKACKYTVKYRKIIERKPYFSETEEPVSATYDFKPLPEVGRINIYHLSDTHGQLDIPCLTGGYFGDDLDLLILNGDIPDHSGDINNFDLIYHLCSNITRGGVPVVFSRGNHDTRGIFAENIAEYTPTENGCSYYTLRLGRIWCMVLDCGEDKDDNHAEYGNTVCCHLFREEETNYINKIISQSSSEYNAEGVEFRLCIVHNPFTHTMKQPFDIEIPVYSRWTELLKNHINPDLIISGHLHDVFIGHPGDNFDNKGAPCPVIIGSKPLYREDCGLSDFIGCGIILDTGEAQVVFTDKAHKIIDSEHIEL